MKKYFLSIVALAGMLFATSCQESIVEPQLGGTTTFTVQLPDAMGTKAFGQASTVTELLVEVYPQNGESVLYQTVEQGSGQFEVALNLIQDQAYDILFWAQTANGYVQVYGDETNGYSFGSLREVPMNSKYLNNDNGAAFFHAEKGFVPNGTSTTITLVRPFAQLNLGTTPASLITDAGEYELVSSAITVTGMANSFNVFSGEGFGNAVATYSFTTQEVPAESEVLSAANATYKYVSMNYLSVLGNEKALVDIEANITVAVDVNNPSTYKNINHKFTSVPVQENYRTNIVGNLISSTTDFNVVVDADFAEGANENPLPDNDYFVVDNVNKAHEALQAGETYIAINSIRNGESVLDLDYTTNPTLYIQLPDTDASLTIQGSNVKELYLSVPNTNATNRGLALVINTPNAHVELDGDAGSFQLIKATTSNNTLVLNGVVVEEVVVEKGNVVVENESTVGYIAPGDNADASTITIYVDDESTVTNSAGGFKDVIKEEEEGDIKFITSAAKLQQLAELVNGGNNFAGQTITLLADIDLNNVEWTPIGKESKPFSGTFDGNNHTISNLVVEGGSSSDQGLFGFTTDGEIKNLIVNNAKVSGRLNVGVVAGTPYTSKYTNIKVTGHVEVNGMAYVGGVAGKNAYANWTNITVEVDETSFVYANSVENGTAYRTYVGGVVGFNGEGGHSFTNIYSNIDVKGSTCDVGGMFGIAHYNNKFVNCVSEGDVEIYAADDIDSAEEIGGIAGVWHNENGTTVTFSNCSFTGKLKTNVEGVDLTDNKITGKAYKSTGTGILIISVDGVTSTFVNSLENLKEAIKNSVDNIILTGDIDASNEIVVISKSVTIDGCGHKLTSSAGRAINVSGVNGVTIKNLTIECSGERAINIIQNATNVTIDNVTATAANYTVNVAASAPEAIVNIENSTLNGLCTVNVSGEEAEVYVNNSTVNCNDNNTTEGEAYAALSLNKDAVKGKIIASETEVNVTEGSDSKKGRNGAEDGEVLINGSTEGVVVMVAAITYPGSDYYYSFASLNEAFEFAQKENRPVTLIRNITVEEPIVIEEGQTVVLNLNGKTITGTMHKSVGAVVENNGTLTIKNGTISSTANNGGSAIKNNGALTVEDATLNGAPNADGSWPAYTVNNTYKMTATNTKFTSYHGSVASYGEGAEVTLDNSVIDMEGIPGFTSHGIYTYNGGKVVVKGGTYTNKATDQASSGASVINGAVEVNAGTFTGRIERYYGTPVIKGGTFNVDPTAFVPKEGYKVVKSGSTWTVQAE